MTCSLRRCLIASVVVVTLACGQDASAPRLPMAGEEPAFALQVRRVTVTPGGDTLNVGESVQLNATALDENRNPLSTRRPFHWASNNPAIISVDNTGLATAHDVGTAVITATLEGKQGFAVLAAFAQSVATVTVTPPGDTLGVGNSLQLTVLLEDAQGNPVSAPVSFSSSDPNVADVSPGGLVTGIGLGSATIFATSQGVTGTSSILVASCSASQAVTTSSWVMQVASNGVRPITGTIPGGSFKQAGALFAGGPLYGTDALHFILGYSTAFGTSDIAPGPVCVLSSSPTQQTWTRLAITAGVGQPAGLVTTQETFATSSGGQADFVLFRYVFANTGSSSIINFSAGWVGDWDNLADLDASSDVLRYNSILGIGEIVDQDTVASPRILGLVPIAASGGTSFRGWGNGQDPTTDDGFFAFLTGGIVPVITGPADVRELMGRGPVSIPAGGHVTMYFAMVGGDNRTAFNANVAAARAAATALGF